MCLIFMYTYMHNTMQYTNIAEQQKNKIPYARHLPFVDFECMRQHLLTAAVTFRCIVPPPGTPPSRGVRSSRVFSLLGCI